MEYKSRYLRETPGAAEALEQIAERGVQEDIQHIKDYFEKNNRWYDIACKVAKNVGITSGIGAVLGYLSTGDAEGAQQGALTGASVSLFTFGIGFPVGYLMKKKFQQWTSKNYTAKEYKKSIDKLLLKEETPISKNHLNTTGNVALAAGIGGAIYATSSGAIDILFGTNFSSWTAAQIGGVFGAYTSLIDTNINSSKNKVFGKEKPKRVKKRIETVIAANARKDFEYFE